MNIIETIIDPYDTLTVMFYAIGTTILAEIGTFFLIYNKAEYKNLKKEIDSVSQKISKQKQIYVSQSQAKTYEKKLNTIENQFKNLNQEMTSYRMKSTLLIGLFMIIALSSFGTLFQGIVVARLPFQPFFLIQGITHRGLIGDDFTECSYIFIYILTSFLLRANIQKIFGFEPPRSHNNFFLNPTGDTKWN